MSQIMNAGEFQARTGFANCVDIPEVPPSMLSCIRSGSLDEPVVFRGLAAHWPATSRWNREYLTTECGERRVIANCRLSGSGVPYTENISSDSFVEISFREYWDEYISIGKRSYLAQFPLRDLGETLVGDTRFSELLVGVPPRELNFWLGCGTKSGMHFDDSDNLMVMVHGKKLSVLAPPGASKSLYPFHQLVTKSSVDMEDPDFTRHPKSRFATLYVAELVPGDVLFVPLSWWHYFSSSPADYSISLNCWFGRSATIGSYIRHFSDLGPDYLAALLKDFMWHGFLGKPFAYREFSNAPEGVALYLHARNLARRLLFRRPKD